MTAVIEVARLGHEQAEREYESIREVFLSTWGDVAFDEYFPTNTTETLSDYSQAYREDLLSHRGEFAEERDTWRFFRGCAALCLLVLFVPLGAVVNYYCLLPMAVLVPYLYYQVHCVIFPFSHATFRGEYIAAARDRLYVVRVWSDLGNHMDRGPGGEDATPTFQIRYQDVTKLVNFEDGLEIKTGRFRIFLRPQDPEGLKQLINRVRRSHGQERLHSLMAQEINA